MIPLGPGSVQDITADNVDRVADRIGALYCDAKERLPPPYEIAFQEHPRVYLPT